MANDSTWAPSSLPLIRQRVERLLDDPPENEAQYKAACEQLIIDVQAACLLAETLLAETSTLFDRVRELEAEVA